MWPVDLILIQQELDCIASIFEIIVHASVIAWISVLISSTFIFNQSSTPSTLFSPNIKVVTLLLLHVVWENYFNIKNKEFVLTSCVFGTAIWIFYLWIFFT